MVPRTSLLIDGGSHMQHRTLGQRRTHGQGHGTFCLSMRALWSVQHAAVCQA